MKLTEMKNIGKVLEKELIEIGITSAEELSSIGYLEAAKRLDIKFDVCCNKLYALYGAVIDMRWHDIPKSERKNVMDEFNSARFKEV